MTIATAATVHASSFFPTKAKLDYDMTGWSFAEIGEVAPRQRRADLNRRVVRPKMSAHAARVRCANWTRGRPAPRPLAEASQSNGAFALVRAYGPKQIMPPNFRNTIHSKSTIRSTRRRQRWLRRLQNRPNLSSPVGLSRDAADLHDVAALGLLYWVVLRLARRVSHVLNMLGGRMRPFSTHIASVPHLALVRSRRRRACCRSGRLIRLGKCGNRREGGERREDNRGPQANHSDFLEHRTFLQGRGFIQPTLRLAYACRAEYTMNTTWLDDVWRITLS